MNRTWKNALAVSLAGITLLSQLDAARACGCFAPPSPQTPVVQAGERILFAHDGTTVTAYIQIQYQGSAAEFGWLVPLPSVPTLELGTDELFTTLGANTNPSYQLTTTRQFCGGGSASSRSSGIGCGALATDASSFGGAASDLGSFSAADAGGPVVVQASIGPYDYAVLKADDRTEMLAWLNDNRYYVPDATGEAVTPYIRPGSYFLALKLRAGESAGDVVPVVLRYASDLPMIPITLTQVGAIPDMGVLVWLLGEARAIPRNYHHVVLDELPVWRDISGYARQAVKAVKEAPFRHAFLTEYAGSSAVMRGRLDYPGRYGRDDELKQMSTPSLYLAYLRSHGYSFDSTLYALLERFIPVPAWLIAQGLTPAAFYGSYDYYAPVLGDTDLGTPPAPFDPVALTDAIFARIVKPTRAASALFDRHPYLTRLYTALSPEDMNVDPVFSENPELPPVPLVHGATLTIPCEGDAWLATDSGFELQYPNSQPPTTRWPAALRVERVREAGVPEVLVDNEPAIRAALTPVDYGSMTGQGPPQSRSAAAGGCACNVRSGFPRGSLETLLLVAGAILLSRRRRRAA